MSEIRISEERLAQYLTDATARGGQVMLGRVEAALKALQEPAHSYGDDVPDDVATLLDNITTGQADPYIEAILAVAHNRKRALRNVPGFPRKD